MTHLFIAGSSSGRFLEKEALHIHGKKIDYVLMDEFIQCAWEATERFWILDPHFCPLGVHGTQQVLSEAKIPDVRILSHRETQKEEYEKQLIETIYNTWTIGFFPSSLPPAPYSFEWRDTLVRKKYPFLHDRFVILDDELWHFGHSACGSSNHLSAATGPWPVEKYGAIEFYEQLWEDFK